MKLPIFAISILAGTAFLVSCNRDISDPQVLVEADMAFSEMSDTEGISNAFIYYADSSVVMLRNGNDPIEGYSALVESYRNESSSNTSLTWHPENAEIAASGELGYTWGKYFLTTTDSLNQINNQTGYYVSIWKKQSDGTWKFVLDGGTTPVSLDQ